MNQLALFAEKSEGPPARPPTPPIDFSSPKGVDKEDTTITRKRKARRPAAAAKEWRHVQEHGLCLPCYRAGVERAGVVLNNAGTHSVLCEACWEKRHPGQLQRAGVA